MPGPGHGHFLLGAVGQMFLKIMPALGHGGEKGAGFHSSSLDRAAETLDALLSSPEFIFLCT